MAKAGTEDAEYCKWRTLCVLKVGSSSAQEFSLVALCCKTYTSMDRSNMITRIGLTERARESKRESKRERERELCAWACKKTIHETTAMFC